ncbi:MAG: putative 60S ribosomal protein L23a [Streblomastix strix]|uniref:Putative 60S ribosomal protein L23a n=1 Tax=Streblomastix strix TaxID=222440 RepID=A0A5J4WRN3_9EUKA|nr:MAG: putative 60S ribosomal protein L23a [Streblomastix strix]
MHKSKAKNLRICLDHVEQSPQARRAMKTIHVKHHKIRKSVHFHLPKTLRTKRKPRFPRKVVSNIKHKEDFDIIRYPVTTESAMRKIENLNTLVFIVDLHASKPQIKRALQRLYSVKCRDVNTLITPKGQKKAYVRLNPEHEAIDIANKIGMV